MANHTPGPWVCYADLPSTDPNWHIVTTANKLRILANVHVEPGIAMDEANSRLITAAPDMLTALKTINEWWLKDFPGGPNGDRIYGAGFGRLSEDTCNIWRSIQAAIAKAEGREG